MEKIEVGFTKPRGKIFPIFSWAIRLFEWSEFSHVYIAWKARGLDRKVVYQASGSMVHFVSPKRFYEGVEIIHKYELLVTPGAKRKIAQWAMDNAGVKYGVLQVVGMAWAKMLCLFGLDAKNPFRDGKESQVCSEMVGYILRDILKYDIQADLDIAGPKLIHKYVSEIKNDYNK